MKFRSLGVLAILAIALIAGCRKEEPEPDKGSPDQQKQAEKPKAPEGFDRIVGGIFITEQPVRVEQYVQYLNNTGQDVPQWVQSPMIDYQDPVTGIEKEEARQLARFLKLSLPTAQHWEKASETVGDAPYPWSDEATEDAVIYLVREWREGSPAEQSAVESRQQLLKEISQMHRDAIKEYAEKLSTLEKTVGQDIKKRWQTFKTELSKLVESQKENARQAAQAEGEQTVLKILRQVGEKKNTIIHAKFNDDDQNDVQKAIDGYVEFLKQQRDNLKALSDKVVEQNQALSKKARDMMKELETRAQTLITDINNTTTGYTARAADVSDPQTLGALKGRAERELTSLEKMAKRVKQELGKTQKELETKAQEIKAEAEEARADEEVQKQIEQVKKKIKGLDENIDAQFDQEAHLFTELQDYVDLTTTKKALEQEVSILQEALQIFEEPEESPPEESESETSEDVESETTEPVPETTEEPAQDGE